MGSSASTDGALALVAITHERAPLEVLERVNLDAEMAVTVARELVAAPGTTEAVVVSTCNRTELYMYGDPPDARAALRILGANCEVPLGSLERCAVHTSGTATAQHLLRVATGLESRVVGEVEVFGQIRTAIARATSSGTAGPNLASLFRFGVAAGRRAQRSSDRAMTPSLPRLALEVLRARVGVTPDVTVVLGSGAMAAVTTAELRRRGLAYRVCARRFERAVLLARSPDEVIPFEELSAALELADLVVCATGARSPLLRAADLERAVRSRRGRELSVVDLSVPRNVEPAARHVAGVRLFDLDDLVARSAGRIVGSREAIVSEQLGRYERWLAGRASAHLITQLRDHVHTTTAARHAATPEGAASDLMTAFTAANRLLHGPILTIKDRIAAGDEMGAIAVLESFGITMPIGAPSPADRVRLREAS